jgi:hypothetical protein
MKSPAIQYTDEQARLLTEAFIAEYAQDAQVAHPPQVARGAKAEKVAKANGRSPEPVAVTEGTAE